MTSEGAEQTDTDTQPGGAVADDWRTAIADPDLQRLAGRYESVGAMAKAVADLRRETSVRIKPLGPDPTPEEVVAFRRQTGVPESAEDYAFDGAVEANLTEGDLAFRQEMAQAMHGVNVTADQATALGATYSDFLGRQRSDAAEIETAALEENLAELQREYGIDYDRNIEFSRRAARMFGNDDFSDFLETKKVDGVPLGDHPAFIRAFARIGRNASEPAIDTASPLGERSTMEERIREKRTDIQDALDRGDHRRAHHLDREERALWDQIGG
jgi:hypothetical protein